ncbi:terminase large subunit [Stenotrophomonas phage BUCT555]|nr:terminase large subunit [Stenotrophomonas phage BUCT555]
MSLAASQVQLPHNWAPYSHQEEYTNYMFEDGKFPYRKRADLVWHRRAGKDSTSINTLSVSAHLRIGTYWHMLPTLNQGRKVVWNGVDRDGCRIIYQAFPSELIESVNENDMLIRFKNGSFYQVVGSDNYDSLVGTNPLGVVFSEWSIADPTAWAFIRPILAENDGFATFIYTPRGKNHAYKQHQTALQNPRWFASRKTVDDTRRHDGRRIILEEDIEQERAEGVLEEVIQQEYYCSFEGVNVGSVYGRHLQKYEATRQISYAMMGMPAWDPNFLVFTAWDIGRRDATAVWFYQIIGSEIRIIDFAVGTGMDASEWLNKIATEFPYPIATPALPHDARAKTFAAKYTTEEIFIQNKLIPYIVKAQAVSQGINAVREIIPYMYFNTDNPNVRKGLDMLKEYKYKYDEALKVFSSEPLHDENSHPADAMRMLGLSYNVMETSFKSRMGTGNGRALVPGVGMGLDLNTLFAEREAQLRSNQSQRV